MPIVVGVEPPVYVSFLEHLLDLHVNPVLKDCCRLTQGGMDRKPQSTDVGALDDEGG